MHTQFKKDFKHAKKRGKKLEKLAHIITELQRGNQHFPMSEKITACGLTALKTIKI